MTTIDPMPERRVRPSITDEEVALLPLAEGRADLLEEIMSTPTLERSTPTARRTAPAWLAAAAAAAAVAAIAVGSALGGEGLAPTPTVESPAVVPGEQQVIDSEQLWAAPVAPDVPAVPGGRYVGVEVVGWQLEALYESYGELTIGWENGEQWLEVVRYPAESYATYFADRDAYREGSPATIFGREATTWPYSRDDHATMTIPADGFFFEVRAAGMPLPAYEELISRLVQTDEAGFYQGLPAGTVTPVNRDAAIADLLQGVTVPEGFGPEDVRLEGFNAPYHAAAAVAGAVSCAWLDVYAAGSAAEQQSALQALEGSRDWPLLLASGAEGAYAEVVWSLAEELRAGADPRELRPGVC